MYRRINFFIKSSAFKSAGIYTFSNFFVKAIGFFLLFVYSNPKYISVDENGLLNLLSSAVFLMMPFLSMGTIQSTNVDFFKLNKEDFRDFFTTSFIIPTLIMFLGILAMVLFRNQLKDVYGFPLSFVFVIPVLTFLNFCNEQFVNAIRNNDEPIKYFKASMLRIFIEISLSLTLVLVFAWRWQGRVTGILVANVVLLFVAYYYFKKKDYLFGKVKSKYIKGELVYAVPIIIFQCSTFCLSSSDKFFLSSFTTNINVGIYGYACVFAAVITIACSGVISYVRPKLYYCLSQPVHDFKVIRKYFIFYTAFCFISFVGVVAVTPILYKYFINAKYYSGLKYMYLIALGYLFWSIGYFFYSFLLYNKQKRTIFFLSVFSIIISLGCNYFFIKQWHEMGAAISVCISYFIVFLATLFSCFKSVKLVFFSNKTKE